MIIRRATIDDVETIVDMGAVFYSQTPQHEDGIAYNKESMLDVIAYLLDHGIVQVADDDGIKGFIAIVIAPSPYEPSLKVATELGYYITPEYRNKGIGTKLLRQAENVARQLGVGYLNMVLLNTTDSKMASAIYESHGYNLAETVFTKEL